MSISSRTHRASQGILPPEVRAEASLPVARLFLLWLLVEDALRNEVSYTAAVAEGWSQNLRWIARGMQPLSHLLKRVAQFSGVANLDQTPKFVARQMTLAANHVTTTGEFPGTGFYLALESVRRARHALAILLERLGLSARVDAKLASWCSADLDEIGSCESVLQTSLNAFLLDCEAGDDTAQCRSSRQLFLSLYWAATFDERTAIAYYEPTLDAHEALVARMMPSVRRDCVQQRLELLSRIPTMDFNAAALRIASAHLLAPGQQ